MKIYQWKLLLLCCRRSGEIFEVFRAAHRSDVEFLHTTHSQPDVGINVRLSCALAGFVWCGKKSKKAFLLFEWNEFTRSECEVVCRWVHFRERKRVKCGGDITLSYTLSRQSDDFSRGNFRTVFHVSHRFSLVCSTVWHTKEAKREKFQSNFTELTILIQASCARTAQAGKFIMKFYGNVCTWQLYVCRRMDIDVEEWLKLNDFMRNIIKNHAFSGKKQKRRLTAMQNKATMRARMLTCARVVVNRIRKLSVRVNRKIIG